MESNVKNGINSKFVHWLTFSAFVMSIVCLVVYTKGVSSSGDTGIAMWATFLFSFVLLSAPMHMLLFLLAAMQFFIGDRQRFKWVYTYLILTSIGHLLVANHYGAFSPNPNDPPELTSTELIMLRVFNGGNKMNLDKLKQALAQGIDANSGFHQGRMPYLVKAASYADAPGIQALLAAGANPNKRASIEYSINFDVSFKQASTLDVVGFSDRGDVFTSIQLLIDAGAKPQGSLLSLGACRKGDFELFEYTKALNAGANVDQNTLVDAKGKTCLHHAAETNQLNFLQTVLLDEQAQNNNLLPLLSVASKNTQFPLDTAIGKKHYAAALVIVKAGGINNQERLKNRMLALLSDDPVVNELKALMFKQGTNK
jgi:hypothetical protein